MHGSVLVIVQSLDDIWGQVNEAVHPYDWNAQYDHWATHKTMPPLPPICPCVPRDDEDGFAPVGGWDYWTILGPDCVEEDNWPKPIQMSAQALVPAAADAGPLEFALEHVPDDAMLKQYFLPQFPCAFATPFELSAGIYALVDKDGVWHNSPIGPCGTYYDTTKEQDSAFMEHLNAFLQEPGLYAILLDMHF